jgi:hypothetical protein
MSIYISFTKLKHLIFSPQKKYQIKCPFFSPTSSDINVHGGVGEDEPELCTTALARVDQNCARQRQRGWSRTVCTPTALHSRGGKKTPWHGRSKGAGHGAGLVQKHHPLDGRLPHPTVHHPGVAEVMLPPRQSQTHICQ